MTDPVKKKYKPRVYPEYPEFSGPDYPAHVMFNSLNHKQKREWAEIAKQVELDGMDESLPVIHLKPKLRLVVNNDHKS
jgi:hypothetical protein